MTTPTATAAPVAATPAASSTFTVGGTTVNMAQVQAAIEAATRAMAAAATIAAATGNGANAVDPNAIAALGQASQQLGELGNLLPGSGAEELQGKVRGLEQERQQLVNNLAEAQSTPDTADDKKAMAALQKNTDAIAAAKGELDTFTASIAEAQKTAAEMKPTATK